jgi:FRG domain
MMNAIKEISCTKAEALLSKLDRGNSLWSAKRQFWVFRGHSNDAYKLLPSALRNTARLGYTFAPKEGIRRSNEEQKDAEFERIHEFYWATDAQGLHVPGESNLLRTPLQWRKLKEDIKKDGWPADDLLPLLALAQHYGVPTRLLDWSDKPLVAAFFAAREAAERKEGTHLGIWAMNLDWVINTAFPDNPPDSPSKLSVYVVTAPRASNPNLHAQGGVFTTECLPAADLPNAVNLRTVDTIIKEKWNDIYGKRKGKPVMVHFTLPVKEAGKLLRLLNQGGINSAIIYPGYKGVAVSLDERKYWDKSERATYWLKAKK